MGEAMTFEQWFEKRHGYEPTDRDNYCLSLRKVWDAAMQGRWEDAAERIADDLFTAGNGQVADRLVLMQEKTGATVQDLGGWCRDALRDRVLKILKQPPADAPGEWKRAYPDATQPSPPAPERDG